MRILLAVAVLALSPATAGAGWSDAEPLSEGPVRNAVAAQGADGTLVTAWNAGGTIVAKVGEQAPFVVGTGYKPLVASGGGESAVAWSGGVSFAAPGGGFAESVPFARGTPVALVANARGDMAVLLSDYVLAGGGGRSDVYVARVFAAFRPAGGAFGVPVEVPGYSESLTLTDAGETLIGLTDGNVVSRQDDGALGAPVKIAEARSVPRLAAAGPGRVVAAFTDVVGNPAVATRTGDGPWQTATRTLVPEPQELVLAAGAGGDAVVAWSSLESSGHSVYAAEIDATGGTVGPRVGLGSPTEASSVAVAVGPEGDAVVAYHDDATREIRVARRGGQGSFTTAIEEVAGCTGYAPDSAPQFTAAGPETLLFAARGSSRWSLASALPAGGAPRACRTPEPSTPFEAVFSDPVVVAGRAVTIDVSSARRPDRSIAYVFWTFPGSAEETLGTAAPQLTHTFTRVGRQFFDVRAALLEEEGTPAEVATFTVPVTVYPRARLRAGARQRAKRVLRRGVRVRASAQTLRDRVGVALELRRGKRRLGSLPRTLGASLASARIALNGAGRKLIRKRKRTALDVVLVQEGAELRRKRIVVTRRH